MGVGDPLEAAMALSTSIPAGTWHLVGDGIIVAPVDVRFDVLLRHPGASDLIVVTFQHHFDPPAKGGFDAVAYEDASGGPPVDVKSGDELVLRFTTMGAPGSANYIPNGDGSKTNGRIPSLTIPQ